MWPRAGSERIEAYLTVGDILSEASTVSDGALSRERSGFYRCGFAALGYTFRVMYDPFGLLSEYGRGFTG